MPLLVAMFLPVIPMPLLVVDVFARASRCPCSLRRSCPSSRCPCSLSKPPAHPSEGSQSSRDSRQPLKETRLQNGSLKSSKFAGQAAIVGAGSSVFMCRFKFLPFLFLLFIAVASPSAAAQSICAQLAARLDDVLADDHCRTGADCASVALPSPWGCEHTINKVRVPELSSTYAEYDKLCGPFIFNCLSRPRTIVCREGSCKGRVTLERRYPSNAPLNEHGRPLR